MRCTPRRRRALRCLVAVLVAAGLTLVAVSCADLDGREVRSDAARATPDQRAVAPTVESLNAFAADLHRQLALRGGNVAVSPYAVAISLAQARLGAAGPTRDELNRLLHTGPGSELDDGLNTLRSALAQRNGERASDVRRGSIELRAAGSLWVQLDTDPRSSLLDDLARYYETGLHSADFRSDPDRARRIIDRWADSATGGQVTQLLPKGSISEFTRFVVPSVASLRAPWKTRFDPQRTRLAPFTTVDGRTVEVPTMSTAGPNGFAMGRGPGWEALAVPYLGDELAMILVVPDQGAFDAVEQSLDGEALGRVIDGLRPANVELEMPRFHVAGTIDLEQPLVALGLRSAFTDGADFSGVTGDEELSISRTVHQTAVGADEQGSDGDAVTVLRPSPASPPAVAPRTVSVDRPFLFLVVDRQTRLVLQMGRVVDPSG
ncbi:serpin family protein [Rhabdothermincola sp.]|uniref:serpin family protein n=1 Tax=Rhabdothermincola sp. TaxID=2820405 RepID=UPI002FE4292C